MQDEPSVESREDTATGSEAGLQAASPAPAPAPPPPRDSFAPGVVLADKYVVERVIGEGGIGVVVAAKHVELDQTVAIKYLRPAALASQNAAERFLREARVAARIRSEHIVHIYDVGRLGDGTPYMVMEHLNGTDLGRLLLASGPLSVERAVDYVLQACEALAEAHVAGIVHRDLKPDNLFLSTRAAGKSVLKILDFGISKLSAKRSTSGRELTHADDKFGTPVYMSPEQLRSSGAVDARADVWAIGVVLFELLTGRLPFDGDQLPELCTAILTMPPLPLRSVRTGMPDGLQEVIEHCLEKECEVRYQNVGELAQDLAPFAPANAQPRIEHIVRIIRDGGDNVRPPTPVPGRVSIRALQEAATLPESDGRRLLTTGGSGATWRAVGARAKRPFWLRGPVLVPAAAVGVLVAAAFIVRSPAPPAGTAVQTLEPAPTQVEAPAAVPSTAPAPAPELVRAPAASTSEPAAGPLVPGLASRRGALAPAGKHASPAASTKKAPRGTATNDPSAVINPFE
ncbi:MAG TPA: protein kinase [Polyangiaceae bacterium]